MKPSLRGHSLDREGATAKAWDLAEVEPHPGTCHFTTPLNRQEENKSEGDFEDC